MADRVNIEQDWQFLVDSPLSTHSLYRKVVPTLERTPIGSVLEVGCLDGKLLEHMAARGWTVAGADLQPQAAEFIVQHDAAEPLPFPDDSFDVVVAVEVIEHLVDTEGFLRNLMAPLKPGGRLIITTPNLLFGVNRLLMLAGQPPRFAYADFHVRMFVWSDLKAKIEAAGLEIEELRGSHVLVGVSRSKHFEVFSRLGDRFPTLAAHFIVTCRKPARRA